MQPDKPDEQDGEHNVQHSPDRHEALEVAVKLELGAKAAIRLYLRAKGPVGARFDEHLPEVAQTSPDQ
jgi:hypothetical protein